jgi:PAS domain S-box-containing protein
MQESGRKAGTPPSAPGPPATLETEVAELRRQLAMVSSLAPNLPSAAPAREDLALSEARYRALLELSPQIVCLTDAEGNATYKNQFWYDFSGMTMAASLGRGWQAAIHPEDAERTAQTWQAAVASGSAYENELRFRRADGQYRWHLARALPLKDSAGKIVKWLAISVDIHDRKMAAAAVAEAEERLRMVMDSAGLGACDYFPSTDQMEFTPHTYKMLRLPPGTEASLATMLACAHPDDRAYIQAVLGGLLGGGVGGDYEIEHRIVWPDGTIRWVLCRGRCVFPAAGPPRLSGAVIDITERKQAELDRAKLTAAVAEAEERLRFVVEAAGVGGCDYYPQSGKTVWSGRSHEILRLAPGVEPSMEAFVERIHPEDRPHIEHEIHRLLENGANSEYDVDYRIVDSDGSIRWLLSKGKCFVSSADGDGDHTRLSGVMLDITERKHGEQERAMLTTAVQNSPDFIGVADREGNILFLNHAGQKLTGVQDDAAARSKKVYDFLFPEERAIFEQQILPAINAGRVWEGEFRLRHLLTGEPVLVENRAFGIFDSSGQLTQIATVSRDIAEKKKLEAQLQMAQKMEAVGQLAGGIAHDFNNLMTIIRGAAEVLEERMEKENGSRSRPVVKEIYDAAVRASALTEQLLAFGRRQMVQPRVLNLNHVVLGAQDMLRRLVGEDIAVNVDLESGLWNTKMDPVQIDQIMLNLASNARDAMPRGGAITIRSGNRVLSEPPAGNPRMQPGQYVSLSFADTGAGMDASTLSHVFEPFFTTKERGKGTGMGLATVYGIVQQCGGHITVQSTPGEGTVFTLSLPRATEDAVTRTDGLQQQPMHGDETILLVEDEPSLRDLVAEYVRERGYTVHTAANAGEAVQVAKAHSIDLLITDLVMPGESGEKLAASLLAQQPDLAVIFISGYAEHAALDEALRQPHVLFLQKPFRFHALVSKVRQAISSRKTQRKFTA